jgi:hypothetical protein
MSRNYLKGRAGDRANAVFSRDKLADGDLSVRCRNAFMFAIALSTAACRRYASGMIWAIARPCRVEGDNRLPTLDVIMESGKVSLGLPEA